MKPAPAGDTWIEGDYPRPFGRLRAGPTFSQGGELCVTAKCVADDAAITPIQTFPHQGGRLKREVSVEGEEGRKATSRSFLRDQGALGPSAGSG